MMHGKYVRGLGYVACKEDHPQFENDVWWSAHAKRYANYDPWAEFEQPAGSHLVIELHAHCLLKTTPCGVWLTERWGAGKRFLNLSWYKQWASPSKKLALMHLVKCKEKHETMSKLRWERAQMELDAAKQFHEACEP